MCAKDGATRDERTAQTQQISKDDFSILACTDRSTIITTISPPSMACYLYSPPYPFCHRPCVCWFKGQGGVCDNTTMAFVCGVNWIHDSRFANTVLFHMDYIRQYLLSRRFHSFVEQRQRVLRQTSAFCVCFTLAQLPRPQHSLREPRPSHQLVQEVGRSRRDEHAQCKQHTLTNIPTENTTWKGEKLHFKNSARLINFDNTAPLFNINALLPTHVHSNYCYESH